MEQKIENQGGAAEEVRPVFTSGDLKLLKRRREWVELVDGKWGCVWEPTVAESSYAAQRASMGGQWDGLKWSLELLASCLRDGDGEDANPIFKRTQDWKALEELPNAIVSKVMGVIVGYGMPAAGQGEALRDFFGNTPRASESES